MVEDGKQEEKLVDNPKKNIPPPKDGAAPKEKGAGMASKISGIFSHPEGKGGSGAVIGMKKAAFSLSSAFDLKKIDLKFINHGLILVLAVVMVRMGYILLRQRPDVSTVEKDVSEMSFQEFEVETVEAFKQMAFYLGQIGKRDIFNEYEEPKPPPKIVEKPKPKPAPPPPKVTIQDKAKGLTLMGISWGSSPKIIIKNAATQQMLFVSEGEIIKGTEIAVKEIAKDEVTLSYDGEEMKMK